jgi:hypothetical protein
MATIRLDRIDQILRQINTDAKQTELVFRDIAAIVERMQTASLAGMNQELRHAAKAAMELDRNLRGAAEARNRLTKYTQPVSGRTAAQAPAGALAVPPTPTLPPDAGAIARQQEFERVLGLSGKSAKDATKFLKDYSFTLKDIKRVMIDPITGTRQFTAELRHADGMISRATFAFDKFGNVIGDSGTRFKGFSDMISRNIVKVLEWAVAVGVVYGALSQLGKVFETLVELDEVMSDITITTQESGEALNQYFESAVVVARETGVAVRDVLSVYDDALRATASLDDQTERLAIATGLLL